VLLHTLGRGPIALAAILFLAGCAGDSKNDSPSPDAPSEVTYHKDIRPIVEQNCTGCHSEGAIAPFVLTSYADVVPYQSAMVSAVTKGVMPPWRARPDCHPLEGDRRLSEADIELFKRWSELDYPEGESRTFVARPALAGVTPPAAEADIVVTMPEPYEAPVTGTDTYQCFVMPFTFDRDTYVKAVDVRPDQHRTVHHVQIHTFPESSRADAEAKDASDPEPGYRCGAGGQIPGDVNIYSWRPGATAVQMLDGDAMLVNAGTGIMIQVHYNIQALGAGEAPPPDQSSIAFWTFPEGEKPERIIVRRGLVSGITGTPMLIKAGEPHYETSTDWPVSFLSTVAGKQLSAEIVGQTPHMHAIGTRLSASLNADGTEDCLVDVPEWSFEWQQDYIFAPEAAVKLPPEGFVRVSCEYDNSPANQPYVQGQKLTPRDITWGEGTYDEMCLNYAWVRFDRLEYEGALSEAREAQTAE